VPSFSFFCPFFKTTGKAILKNLYYCPTGIMANHLGPTPDWLNSDYLETILRESQNSPKLKVTNVDITAGSKAGDNYACQIFRVSVDYTENGKESKKSIIAKYLPKTKLLESISEAIDVYGTESKYFKTLLPLQRKYVKKGSENFVPVCLKIDDEKKSIFMEDLGVQGYSLQERGKFLDKIQCELVIDALATFHGTSLYALDENPKLSKEFTLGFWTGERNEAMHSMFENCQKTLERCSPDYDLPEKYKSALVQTFARFRTEYCKVRQLVSGIPISLDSSV